MSNPVYQRTKLFVHRIQSLFCIKRFGSHKRKESVKPSHIYKSVGAWNTIQELSRILAQNVLHQENGLVFINKPYGLPVTGEFSSSGRVILQTLNSKPVGADGCSLTGALPHLATALGYDTLTLLKTPERYTSGVAMLSSRDAETEKVQKRFKEARNSKSFIERYCAVVVGVPKPEHGSQTLGITLKTAPDESCKKAVLVSKWSKQAVSRGEVKVAVVKHETVSVAAGGLASLVHILPTTTRWHLIRLFLANQLSPILGDHLFGSRVKNVLGIPLLVNPFSDVATMPQKLDGKLLSMLQLKEGQESLIPVHIHKQELIIPDYYSRGNDLIVKAQLPETFLWTCQTVGLSTDSMS